RSGNAGKTWSRQQVLWDDGDNTCGNPCVVADETAGTILLLATHNPGGATEKQITSKTGAPERTVWLLLSKDDGRTWSSPSNITASVKDPSWGWYATGPGVGIQVQHGKNKGRLIIPCDHTCDNPAAADQPGFIRGSHVIYSDDHGRTWSAGGPVRPNM